MQNPDAFRMKTKFWSIEKNLMDQTDTSNSICCLSLPVDTLIKVYRKYKYSLCLSRYTRMCKSDHGSNGTCGFHVKIRKVKRYIRYLVEITWFFRSAIQKSKQAKLKLS